MSRRTLHETYNPDVHSERTDTNIGALGWMAIAGFVTAWDLTQEQTLSNFAHRESLRPPYTGFSPRIDNYYSFTFSTP